MIQGTGCEAVLVVVLAARDRILKKVGKTLLPRLVVYASDQTHSSFRKACLVGILFNLLFKNINQLII